MSAAAVDDNTTKLISALIAELRALAFSIEIQTPRYVGARGLAQYLGVTENEIRRLTKVGVIEPLPTEKGHVALFDRQKSLRAVQESMAAHIQKGAE